MISLSDILAASGVCLGCLGGLALGALGMMALYIVTGRPTWSRLRRRSRPLLWYLGLDWKEIRRTWKRAFACYYARSLPESQQPDLSSESPDDDLLDESGDVPPAASPLTS